MKKIILLIVLVVLAVTFFLALTGPEEEGAPKGYVELIQKGRAGGQGYWVVFANGTGNVTLLSLDEKPKKMVLVLSETGIGMDGFDEFVGSIAELGEYGITVNVIGKGDVRGLSDAVIIVPTGAIPEYILEDIDYLSDHGNQIVYIGRTDFVLGNNLRKDYWYTQLGNGSQERVIVIDSTLDEFVEDYSAMERLKADILTNEWALVDSEEFIFHNFDGKKSVFADLPESGYLRIIYSAGEQVGLEDSDLLSREKITVDVTEDIYPWEKAELSFSINRSAGKVLYSLEKDATQIASEELGLVVSEKAYYYSFEFEDPGDYVFKVYDNLGVLGSAHMHVKDIEIKIDKIYDVRVFFNVTVDGEPVQSGKAYVSLEGEGEREYTIVDGVMSVPTKLKSGENIFRVRYLEFREKVVYDREGQGIFDVYLRYGPIALIAIIAVYAYGRARRKPTYRLKIETMGQKKRNSVFVNGDQILYCLEHAEKTFGWKNIPVHFTEIVHSVKKNITDGADIFDGDLDAILRRLEEKGEVESYGDYYQLKGWGDVKDNTIRRQLRDKLVVAGERFTEEADGFRTDDYFISTKYLDKKGHLIVVFENEQDRRSFLKSLPPKERAMVDLKMENDLVRMTTLEGLDDML